MHYYQFNIGDYASHTSRLTPIEDLAYRRMIDLYYLNEQPLLGGTNDVAREIGLLDHVDSVKYILGKFFIENENCFSQKRIDLEIKKYKENHKSKIKAGKASAKARRAKASSKVTGVEQVLNTSITNDELNINQEPRTKNHKPLTKVNSDLVAVAPKFNFKNELVLLGVDEQVINDWLIVRKNKKASNTKTALTTIINQAAKVNITPAEAITYANGEGWKGFKAEWYSNNIQSQNKNVDILTLSSTSDWHKEPYEGF